MGFTETTNARKTCRSLEWCLRTRSSQQSRHRAKTQCTPTRFLRGACVNTTCPTQVPPKPWHAWALRCTQHLSHVRVYMSECIQSVFQGLGTQGFQIPNQARQHHTRSNHHHNPEYQRKPNISLKLEPQSPPPHWDILTKATHGRVNTLLPTNQLH